MGVVYEAEQIALGRHVALKVLSAETMRDEKQKRGFEREARAAGRLHDTNPHRSHESCPGGWLGP